jgi:hypothetical protein
MQLLEALDADNPHIPTLSEPLRAIAEQVELEMNSCAVSFAAEQKEAPMCIYCVHPPNSKIILFLSELRAASDA